MSARKIALTLAWCLVAVAVCYAGNPNMGTWKMDESKSKLPAGITKNTTVVYSSAGDETKVITDGTTGDGKPAHTEWTGKFDGKDYPLTGDPAANTRSYTIINDHSTELTNKMNGKVTATGRITISSDGKTRTVKVSGTAPDGKKFSYTAYYDKQ